MLRQAVHFFFVAQYSSLVSEITTEKWVVHTKGHVFEVCRRCALSEILTRPYKLPVIFRKFHSDLITVLMRWEKSALCRRKKKAAFGDPKRRLDERAILGARVSITFASKSRI